MAHLDQIIKSLKGSRPNPLPFWNLNDAYQLSLEEQKAEIAQQLKAAIGKEGSLVATMLEGLPINTFTALVESCERYTNFKTRKRAEVLNARKQDTDKFVQWWREQLREISGPDAVVLRTLLKDIKDDKTADHESRWLILLHESKPFIYQNKAADERSKNPPLLKAIDQHLGLATPDDPHHDPGRQVLNSLDFSEFRSVFIALLQLAEQIAGGLSAEFWGSKPPTQVIWLLRAYIEESENNLKELGSLKEIFQSAQDGLTEAIHMEDDLMKADQWKNRLDFYAYPFGHLEGYVLLNGFRHAYLAARIAIASLAYQEDKCLAKWLLEMFWQASAASRTVRVEPPGQKSETDISILTQLGEILGRLDDEKTAETSRAASPEVQTGTVLHKLKERERFKVQFSTEYNNSEQWITDPTNKGSLVTLASQYRNSPRKIDHQFVRTVLQKLLDSNTFNKHAIVAIASKLAVYYRDNPEPRCSVPYSAGGKRTAAADMVRRMKNLVNAVTDQKVQHAALSAFVESIYPTASQLDKDGFDWKSDRGSRNLRSSDRHIEYPEAIGSHLWLVGKRFQEVVDGFVDEVGRSLSATGTPYQGSGDRFSRFLFLVPHSDPLSRQSGNDILSDWPGWLPMRLALREIAQFSNDVVNLEKTLFLPITSVEKKCANPGPYFQSIPN